MEPDGRDPNEPWFDFYFNMRKGLNQSDRNKLDEVFFGNTNNLTMAQKQSIYNYPTHEGAISTYNRPRWSIDEFIRRPDIAFNGENAFISGAANRYPQQYNSIVETQPKRYNLLYQKYSRELNDPIWMNTASPEEITKRQEYLRDQDQTVYGYNEDGLLDESSRSYKESPELVQALRNAEFETKWDNLPRHLRSIMGLRKDLYNSLTPEAKDLITPPEPQRVPEKPKRVDWEESRTKNLETTPVAKDALVTRILQSLSGKIEPDFQAGTIDPSIAGGNPMARSAINDQNIAVMKERMAARKEATPWLARFLAPETPSGIIMDPRLTLPGFTEDNTMRPKLDKNDPVVRQIEAQNKSVKKSTMPSRSQKKLNERMAKTELQFMEDDLKQPDPSKRKWFKGRMFNILTGAATAGTAMQGRKR